MKIGKNLEVPSEFLEVSKAIEMSVPSTFDDFETGDRVWCRDSKTIGKRFFSVLDCDNTRMKIQDDDGFIADITDNLSSSTHGYPLINFFGKCLKIDDLRVGDRISKQVVLNSGGAIRVYAEVLAVYENQKIYLTFQNKKTGKDIARWVEDQVKGVSLEDEMSEWELE